jgi:hypothetical protein
MNLIPSVRVADREEIEGEKKNNKGIEEQEFGSGEQRNIVTEKFLL